jgi:hypothetical protein
VDTNALPSQLQAMDGLVTESWDHSAMFVKMGPDVPEHYIGRGKPKRADGQRGTGRVGAARALDSL